MRRENKTSWNKVAKWYGEAVGEKGHYYHQKVIMPNCLRLLGLKEGMSLLDIACGQGVLARQINKNVNYVGVDASVKLIEDAKKMDRAINHKYKVGDATKELQVDDDFDRATVILALQNIKEPDVAINNISKKLRSGGKLLLVINHPSFRIPRQSSWGMDEASKLQYRKVNRYMSPLEIPINVHPGKDDGQMTWSFHRSLNDYSNYLYYSGFLIEKIEEWTSDKESEGKAAKMENRARDEFPLFMAILAIKK